LSSKSRSSSVTCKAEHPVVNASRASRKARADCAHVAGVGQKRVPSHRHGQLVIPAGKVAPAEILHNACSARSAGAHQTAVPKKHFSEQAELCAPWPAVATLNTKATFSPSAGESGTSPAATAGSRADFAAPRLSRAKKTAPDQPQQGATIPTRWVGDEKLRSRVPTPDGGRGFHAGQGGHALGPARTRSSMRRRPS
jgi:hypothetical protein